MGTSGQRWGRAPPIEFFTGEDLAIMVDDWLPSLEWASLWNSWYTSEKLMQLPGYLNVLPCKNVDFLAAQSHKTMRLLSLGLDSGS